jgi:hypothetical protein
MGSDGMDVCCGWTRLGDMGWVISPAIDTVGYGWTFNREVV